MNQNCKIAAVCLLATTVVGGSAFAAWRQGSPSETVANNANAPIVASVSLDKDSSAVVSVTANSEDAALANLIFRVLGIPVAVQEVSTLKTTRNMGYGEITLAYNLAHAAHRPVGDILSMRYDQKMGWGKIAKVLGVKLHDASNRSLSMLREGSFNKAADDFGVLIQVDLDNEDRPDADKSNGSDKDKPQNHGKNNEKSHGKKVGND